MEYIEITAKTVSEAITKACLQLSVPSERLDIQVISEGSKGFLGIGTKPAVIKVSEKKQEEEKLAEKKAVVKEKKKEAPKKPVKEKKPEVKADKPEDEEVKKSEDNAEEKVRKNRNRKRDNSRKGNRRPERAENHESRRQNRPEEKREAVIKTEEEIASMKKMSDNFLKDVFKAMEIPVEIKSEYIEKDGCLEIDLIGDDMGVLIGKRGQTLDSLQYLTSLVVNKEQKEYVRVKLDTEDYRRRRKETLENLANNIASKVKKTRKTVVLEPMNPYERRIIHSALQPNKFVETYSDGNEPYRHVVVTLKKRKEKEQ